MSLQTSPREQTSQAGSPVASRRAAAGTLALAGQAPVWLWWAVTDGGFSRSHWLAGALYLALLVCVLAFAQPPAPPRGWFAALALAGLGGLAAWSALSAAWAPDAGAALTAAAQKLLVAHALALPLLWPPPRSVAIGGACTLTGVALLAGAVGLVRAAGDAATLIDGRLAQPLGYPNAVACLGLMGAMPALWAAAHGRMTATRRAACLAAAVACAALALLAQSRGAAATLAVVVLLALAASPSRLRLLGALGIGAGAVALASGPLLDLRLAALENDVGPSVRDAALAVLGAAALAAVLSPLVARIPEQTRWPASRNAGRLTIAAGLLACAVGFVLATGGDPVGWTADRIDSLRTPNYGTLESTASGTRFTGDLGSDRTDYWRVALRLAGERPIAGSGAGSFAGEYVRLRHVDRYPWHAHSAPLEAVAELGLPGALLGIAAAAGLLGALITRRRDVLVVVLLLPAATVAAQAAVDWVSEVPLVATPAAALAGAALALGPAARPGGRRLRLATGVAAAALVLALLPLLLAARYEERASQTWRSNPDGALTELERATRWDPLSARLRLAEGIVALQAGRDGRARSAFAAAAERDANGWIARLLLGLLEARADNAADARGQIAEARTINPREALLSRAAADPRAPDPRATALQILASPG
jgi:hypothetical protein